MKKQSVIKFLAILLLSPCGLVSPVFGAVPSLQKSFPEGERLVYTRLVEAFRHGKMQEVVKQKNILERNYSSSVHLDNAYQMVGILEFQSGRFGEALKSFQVVRTRFPKSNKRPSAMFATAMTYQKLNLAPQSNRVMQELMQEYPGSPEALRAKMYLKLEKGSSGTLKR